jgi:carbon storage regulator
MLVLSRKFNESIVIDGGIKITVVEICGNRIRLGIEAPREIGVNREEVADMGPKNTGSKKLIAAAV